MNKSGIKHTHTHTRTLVRPNNKQNEQIMVEPFHAISYNFS